MKTFIRVVLLVGLLVIGMAYWLTDPAPSSQAETVGQMRLRIFQDAQTRHSDVWNGCDSTCINARVAAAPFLSGLAKQAKVDLNDLVRYAVVRSFEWGQEFENLYGHPPSVYDWEQAYANQAERLRYEVAASPVIFAVNEWDERRYFRLKREYGGPW